MLSWDEFDKDENEVTTKGQSSTQASQPGIDKLDSAGGAAALKRVLLSLPTPKPSNVPRLPSTPSTLPKAWPSWKAPRPALQ